MNNFNYQYIACQYFGKGCTESAGKEDVKESLYMRMLAS